MDLRHYQRKIAMCKTDKTSRRNSRKKKWGSDYMHLGKTAKAEKRERTGNSKASAEEKRKTRKTKCEGITK